MLVSLRKLVYLNKKEIKNEKRCRDGMPKNNTNKDLNVKVIYKASSLHLHYIVKRCMDG